MDNDFFNKENDFPNDYFRKIFVKIFRVCTGLLKALALYEDFCYDFSKKIVVKNVAHI